MGWSAFQGWLVDRISKHRAVRTVPLDDVGSQYDGGNTIGLDAMVVAKHNLAISRLFALGGYSLLGHVERPGRPPIADQLERIPSGEYTLCDDDCMTGSTVEAVRAMLPDNLRIVGTRLALPHGDDEEVVDSRDFLLGADDGGLVVELADGVIARAPYILPYVDPAVRASLPASSVHAFSTDVWRLNEQAFRGSGRTVADLPAPARQLFRLLDDQTPLDAVCRWHVDRLEKLQLHGV
jgi:hypothetical protein